MLKDILKKHKSEFFSKKLCFYKFLEQVEESPEVHLRNSAMYIKDTFDYFGKAKGRFKLFHSDLLPSKKVYGNNKIQELIYGSLQNFIEEGYNNKLLLLVGPNGSAKTSLVNKVMEACEHYSKQDEGALYTFSWIFPAGGTGFQGGKKEISFSKAQGDPNQEGSYAYLNDDEIGSMVASELRDHPILLIPKPARQEYLTELLKDRDPRLLSRIKKTYLYLGDVSKQNKDIFNALLKQYDGDSEAVFRHVRVERYDISKRYSKSIATVEPQVHVDAQMQQVTMDEKVRHLPPSIQALNLIKSSGELVYANRGVLEFSDFFKRNSEANKYLLMTIESRNLNIHGILTELDILFFATSNELYYDAFQNSADFKSFKARFKTIHVPYLLSFKDEKHIYKDHVKNVDLAKFENHALEAFALWTVMTRLHEPKAEAHKGNEELYPIVSKIDGLDKSLIYAGYNNDLDRDKFSREDIRVLKRSRKELQREFVNRSVDIQQVGTVNYYEGRFGVSPREAKEMLLDLCQKNEKISFFEVLEFVEQFEREKIYGDEKTTRLVEAIERDQSNGSSFKSNEVRVKLIKEFYKKKFDEELRDSLDLVDSTVYEEYIKKYIHQVNSFIKNEKVFNEMTGRAENVDLQFLETFEEKIDIDRLDREKFRNDVITKLGAYAIEHKKKPENYCELFKDEIYSKLRSNFVESQKVALEQLATELHYYQSGEKSENTGMIDDLLKNLETKYKYTKDTALRLISFVYKE